MDDSFPADEREDSDLIVANIESGKRLCFVSLDDEVLVALAVVQLLTAAPIALLEYLAVSRDRRPPRRPTAGPGSAAPSWSS